MQKDKKKLVFFVHPRPAQPRQHNQPWPLLLQRPLQPHLGGLLVLRGPQVQDPVQESHCEYIPAMFDTYRFWGTLDDRKYVCE